MLFKLIRGKMKGVVFILESIGIACDRDKEGLKLHHASRI